MKKIIAFVCFLAGGICAFSEKPSRMQAANPEGKIFKYNTTIEKERPELNEATQKAILAYRKNPTQENYDALLAQVNLNYDDVIARKVAKLEELKTSARYEYQITDMQEIVDETIAVRDLRIKQSMARFTDPRFVESHVKNEDFHPLLGAALNVDVAHTPVTNAQYAEFTGKKVKSGEENLPVVNVSIKDIEKYCAWLGKKDGCVYRLPTEYEWQLAAGHMPKDADFNVEEDRKLTPVEKYSQTTGASGGIDFWGNVWEWTSTKDDDGKNVVKGRAYDSKRMDCRTENNEQSRDSSKRYKNVGFRLVRES